MIVKRGLGEAASALTPRRAHASDALRRWYGDELARTACRAKHLQAVAIELHLTAAPPPLSRPTTYSTAYGRASRLRCRKGRSTIGARALREIGESPSALTVRAVTGDRNLAGSARCIAVLPDT